MIECIQYGPKNSSLSWRKLLILGTRKLATGAGYVNLKFDSVQHSNGGEYRCVSTDGVAETVHVFVGGKKYFTNIIQLTNYRGFSVVFLGESVVD